MAANEVPVEISSSEFMEGGGGLYSGGTCRVTDIGYVLWDYNGQQPKDSVFAVRIVLQPIDGSNEGKPDVVFWTAGKATEFCPNLTGTKPMALQPSTAPNLRDNSNWAFVHDKFVNTCGMKKGQLDGPQGIKILTGSDITFSRVDQPKRDNMDEAPPAPGAQPKKKFKPTILVPVRAKFSWEQGGVTTSFAQPTPGMAPTAMAAAPPSMSNGHVAAPAGDTDALIKGCLEQVLIAANGTVAMDQIPQLVGAQLTVLNYSVQDRLKLIPIIKDPATIARIAAANGWQFNNVNLSA